MIELKNVSFSYGKEDKTLSHVNLKIRQGETVLLCGESGCGKTTLIRLMNGLIPQYYSSGTRTGTVSVAGRDPASTPLYDLAETVGSVFQNPKSQFFNVDTTSEIVFSCENMGMPEDTIRSRLQSTVEKLQMTHLLGRNIFGLSGGEKQKIACAGVSMLSPPYIVLDEPTSNLDIPSIHMLRKVIAYWKSQGKTIVIAEHRLWFLKDLADRVVYLQDGKIVEDFEAEDFFSKNDSFFRQRGLRSVRNDCPCFPVHFHSGHTLTVQNLHYTYQKGREALDIQELTIPIGQVTAIVGHNGAGKSTLVSCLCGLLKKDKSRLTFDGKSFGRRERMNLVFPVLQDVNHQLFTESVLDEVLLSMDTESEMDAECLLAQMDLDRFAASHPMALSGGQKQRVAIASALASGRQVLILDEPTSGLDLKHMEQVAELICSLKRQGKTILVITHDAELIRCCCDGVIALEHGKLVDFDEHFFS